jgi:subtilase family serine protease
VNTRPKALLRTLAAVGALTAAVAVVPPSAFSSVAQPARGAAVDIRASSCNHGGLQAKGDHVLRASCLSYINVTATRLNASRGKALPAGYGPADLQSAYKIASAASTRGAGQTIAIVDAFDDPNAAADLNTYRSTFGLPACTTANGCFTKLNQNGQARAYPAPDAGWAGEISLDLDMVSAACPNCKIILVEANNASVGSLGIAENTAAGLADVVSNSFGLVEQPGLDASPYNHTGTFIVASTGDAGFGKDDVAPQFPSVLPRVTAVGGTALNHATNTRGWTEKAWGPSGGQNWGAGSGCSTLYRKPVWQTDAGCAKRITADVSAVADPVTGVAVRDTYQQSGWLVFGGTSASSPLVAGVVGLAQNGSTVGHDQPYANRSSLFDVTSGNNITGATCVKHPYFCHGVVGYDGPTGLGTPKGYLAF